jgi:hypothetical protein
MTTTRSTLIYRYDENKSQAFVLLFSKMSLNRYFFCTGNLDVDSVVSNPNGAYRQATPSTVSSSSPFEEPIVLLSCFLPAPLLLETLAYDECMAVR